MKNKIKNSKWCFIVTNIKPTIENLKSLENIVEANLKTIDGDGICVTMGIKEKYPEARFDIVRYTKDNDIELDGDIKYNLLVIIDKEDFVRVFDIS